MIMDDIFKLLNPDNTLTINRPLAHVLGINAAIVFSALLSKQFYYEKRGMLDAKGYFYSTIADLEESTSLSKRKQSSAIDTLIEFELIDCQKRGMPAKRCFRVCDDAEVIGKYIECGKNILNRIKTLQNVTTSRNKTARQAGAECNNKSEQNTPRIYNQNQKSKIINQNLSILPDGTDRIGFSNERELYLALIRKNIGYEYRTDKEKIDSLVSLMLDVICSARETIRVNGENKPHEVVKSRFLKITGDNIDYVLNSMKKNTNEVKNIRAYLITALYNATNYN